MSDGLTLEQRQKNYDEHVERRASDQFDWYERECLGPLIRGINEVIGGTPTIALKRNTGKASLGGNHVCIVDAVTGKALSVYMQYETMRKRLEFTARILGADLVAEASA